MNWYAYVKKNLSLPELTREREEQIREDLALQFEQACADALARGLSESDAEAAARAHVPDWESFISDVYRSEQRNAKPRLDKWSNQSKVSPNTGGIMNSMNRWLSDFRQDVIYGLRSLRKSPGFTTVAVLTLALGIGTVTAIFSMVNSIVLRPLPYPNAERIVFPWIGQPNGSSFISHLSSAQLKAVREQTQTLASIEIYRSTGITVTGDREPQRAFVTYVSEGMIASFGVVPQKGRLFTPDDYEPGAEKIVLLSHETWRARHGSDPNILGRSISLGDVSYRVIGIMPKGFRFIETPVNYYLPLEPDGHGFAIAWLQPGISLDKAQTEMNVISSRLDFTRYGDVGWKIVLMTPSIYVASNFRTALWIFLGAGAFVLLIACANVTNLILARTASRRRELALRSAVGGSRSRLFRQIITETLLLASLGGIGGLALSLWFLNLVSLLRPEEISELAKVRIDVGALMFSFSVSMLVSLFFGLLPAWRASRSNLADTLKETGSSTGGSAPRGWVRAGLVVTEVALSLVLLMGAGLLVTSFMNLTRKELGFRSENLLSVRLSLDAKKYPDTASREAFFDSLVESMQALPQVEQVLVANTLPPSSGGRVAPFEIEGQNNDPLQLSRYFPGGNVQPSFFRLLGIPLLEGRSFEELDTTEFASAAIVNQSLAKHYWPIESALGKRFKLGRGPWRIVTGVIADVDANVGGRGPSSNVQIYTPVARWGSTSGTVIIKSSVAPAALASLIKARIWNIDPRQPVGPMLTVDDIVYQQLAKQRFNGYFMSMFAGLALTLALVGLYGVLSYSTVSRTHEIGIRIALGAAPRDVLKLVMRQGTWMILLGVTIGLGGSLALTRLLKQFLYGVSPTDLTTFGLAAVLLVVVSLLACYIPARRATKIDPMVALRYE